MLLNKRWSVNNGEIMALFGPSGSGKTVTLKCIAGLVSPDEGIVQLADRVYYHSTEKVNLPPRERQIGYAPQNYALFPHLSVAQNVAYGLHKKKAYPEHDPAFSSLLESTGVKRLWNRYPRHLSGGEKQRVALLRAMAINPKLLLLDEPFAAVDMTMRNILRSELKYCLQALSIPIVLVTHDPDDIDALCNRVEHY